MKSMNGREHDGHLSTVSFVIQSFAKKWNVLINIMF